VLHDTYICRGSSARVNSVLLTVSICMYVLCMPGILYCAEAKSLEPQLQTQVCQPHGRRDSRSQGSGFNNK